MKLSTVVIALTTSALALAAALPSDASDTSNQSLLSSNTINGVIKCEEDTLECTVACGEGGRALCRASTKDNQYRLKLQGYRLECKDLKCKVRCTQDTVKCSVFGSREFTQLKADTEDLEFGNALDSAGKIVTDLYTGYLAP